MNTRPSTPKVYRRRARVRPTLPEISDELIFEILLRLPAKTLVRFRSVSKAWRATISGPFFIRSHLQQSTRIQSERGGPLSFLITPHTLDRVIDREPWPTTFSNAVAFYLWQEDDAARLVHAASFPGEFGSVYTMSHCDGLVVLPTDVMARRISGGRPRPAHRFFYRSLDFSTRAYSAGMEFFTVCDGGDGDPCWRNTVEDPPFPVAPRDPTYLKGSLYMHIWGKLVEKPPEGFLRFDLEDETFSFIRHPKVLSANNHRVDFVELGGELCLAECRQAQLVIWTLRSGNDGHEWVQRYAFGLPPEAWNYEAFSVMHRDGIFVRTGNHFYRSEGSSHDAREVLCLDRLAYENPIPRDLFFFNAVPYTESLVPVTKARQRLLA